MYPGTSLVVAINMRTIVAARRTPAGTPGTYRTEWSPMRRLSWWPVVVVAALSAASLAVLGWGARTAGRAYDCLGNGDYPADVTDRGCEIHTAAGTRVVPLDGPGFEVTVTAAAVLAVLLVVLVVLVARRLLSRRPAA